MNFSTDVLHDLVRRGLTLRIDTTGTLFIYDHQRRARDADAVFDPPLQVEARTRRRKTARRADPPSAALCAATTTVSSEVAGAAATSTTATASTAASDAKTAATDSTKPAAGTTKRATGRGTRARAKAGAATTAVVTILPDHGSFVPTGANWRGITWRHMPGHDEHLKKLNFALLKRGMLHGHKCCTKLHGEALRQRLREISERNRDKPSLRHDPPRPQNAKRARKPPRTLPP